MKEKFYRRVVFIAATAVSLLVVYGASTLVGQTAEEGAEVDDGTTRVYIIRPGDTLWDISGRFMESPFAWPRLWEENEFVTNPHLIFPGDPLVLSGSPLPPPTMEPTVEPPPVEPDTTEAAPDVAVVPDEPVPVPMPQPQQPMEATDLTGLLEEEFDTAVKDSNLSLVPTFDLQYGQYYYSTAYRTGFISPEKLNGLGAIVGSFRQKSMLSNSDKVYVNLGADSGVQVGDRFTIFRSDDEIEHPITGDDVGFKIEIIGSLTIEDIHEDVSTARIYLAYDAIKVGDRLRPYEPTVREIVLRRTEKEAEGYIIATRENGLFVSPGNVTYIDLGTEDGLFEGNELAVFLPGKEVEDHEDFSDRDLRLPDEFIGFLVVVQAGEKISSALVTSAIQEMEVGMQIRAIVE